VIKFVEISTLNQFNLFSLLKAMFKRAAPFQVSLSASGALGGLLVYYLSKEKNYFYSSMILLSITPYTLVFMMPTNYALMDPANDRGSEKTKGLLKKWGRLHAVRSVLGLAAATFLLYNA
jgi:uncharacterized membrane protein